LNSSISLFSSFPFWHSIFWSFYLIISYNSFIFLSFSSIFWFSSNIIYNLFYKFSVFLLIWSILLLNTYFWSSFSFFNWSNYYYIYFFYLFIFWIYILVFSNSIFYISHLFINITFSFFIFLSTNSSCLSLQILFFIICFLNPSISYFCCSISFAYFYSFNSISPFNYSISKSLSYFSFLILSISLLFWSNSCLIISNWIFILFSSYFMFLYSFNLSFSLYNS